MTRDLVENLRARRSLVLTRWTELLRETGMSPLALGRWRMLMDVVWENVLLELEQPHPTGRPRREHALESLAAQMFYAAGERAFREALLAASDSLDARTIAAAAEQLSHAIERMHAARALASTTPGDGGILAQPRLAFTAKVAIAEPSAP